MKQQWFLWILLAGSWLWLLPQVYVGSYASVVGKSVYYPSLLIITACCIGALWLMLSRFRLSVANAIPYLLLGFWVVAAFIGWKIAYARPGQIYKLVWIYTGVLTPVWALAAAGGLMWGFQRRRVSS